MRMHPTTRIEELCRRGKATGGQRLPRAPRESRHDLAGPPPVEAKRAFLYASTPGGRAKTTPVNVRSCHTHCTRRVNMAPQGFVLRPLSTHHKAMRRARWVGWQARARRGGERGRNLRSSRWRVWRDGGRSRRDVGRPHTRCVCEATPERNPGNSRLA